MATHSSKNGQPMPLDIRFDGGINYADSPTHIADNELQRALNFIYDVSTDYLTVRPGTSCTTSTTIGAPILKLHYYEKTSADHWLMAAGNGNLSYLVTSTWSTVGALTDSTTVPSMLTFNNKLLVADGSANIRTWDGTSYTTISTSPQATILHTIKNRVVANATDEPDSVYLSAANDETGWNTATTAVGLKVGYGDMLTVNGFAVFGDNLIVSKKGASEKRIYRVDVSDPTPTNWVTSLLSSNNAAQGTNVMCEAFNNVFFADTNGFKSLKGVNEYGDLQVDPMGEKVNVLFTTITVDEMRYIPMWNAILFNISDRIFVYSEKENKPRFTDLLFQQGRIRSFCQVNNTLYLGGHNGYLYEIDDTLATDETAPNVTAYYSNNLRTKAFSANADLLLKKIQLFLLPKNTGSANLYAVNNQTETLVKTFDIPASQYLNDATGDLNDETGFLYNAGALPFREMSRNRVRGIDIAFQLSCTSGRVGIEKMSVDMVSLEGGE